MAVSRRHDVGDQFPSDIGDALPLVQTTSRAEFNYTVRGRKVKLASQVDKILVKVISILDVDTYKYLLVKRVIPDVDNLNNVIDVGVSFFALPWFGQNIEDYEFAENIVMTAERWEGQWYVWFRGDLPFVPWPDDLCNDCSA